MIVGPIDGGDLSHGSRPMESGSHLEILKSSGVAGWNDWRKNNPSIFPTFRRESLYALFVDRKGTDGQQRRLLKGMRANLSGINLSGADCSGAFLEFAALDGADLTGANFEGANLTDARLLGANLSGARLTDANLRRANLTRARMCNATLMYAQLNGANLEGADLTNCNVYGVSAWNVRIDDATNQSALRIENYNETIMEIDNLELAQFIYLMLKSEKIRDIIDTIGKKAVLILGRFAPERKKVLDAVRNELRKFGYLPILFDFDKPESKDLTGTVMTLAHMARFIVVDLTEPSSVPYELSKIADAFVPVQPILFAGKAEFAMFRDLQRRYDWVLPTHHYASTRELLADLKERVIGPAEAKIEGLRPRRSA